MVTGAAPAPVAGSTRSDPWAGVADSPAGAVSVKCASGRRSPSRNALTVTCEVGPGGMTSRLGLAVDGYGSSRWSQDGGEAWGGAPRARSWDLASGISSRAPSAGRHDG